MLHINPRRAAAPDTDPAGGGGTPSGPRTYTMDPGHTEVIARWDHFGFSTPAAMFSRIEGTLVYDPDQPETASAEVVIPVSSLHTTVPLQDEHLKGEEFFDAQRFPEIRFRSTEVKRGAARERLAILGELTVHGVTKRVSLDAALNKTGFHEMVKGQAVGFDAEARLKRSDFGVGAHVPRVGDRIDLRLTVEAVESKAWQAFLARRAQ